MRIEGNFAAAVLEVVARIPRGRVTTYGRIAALCGAPRAARQVGWVLAHTPSALPWQRVINRAGRLSIVHPLLTPQHQATLLRREGIPVLAKDRALWVDLCRFGWQPRARAGIV